ncbi:MAG TPA: hypothetical protein VIU33_00390 [Nitrospiria bacterium]
MVSLAVFLGGLGFSFPASAQGGETIEGLIPWAVHAHRYQDFGKNKIMCEVFGEVKNSGKKPLKSFTLHLEMLDEKGKTVSAEDLTLQLRVIETKNARGTLRAVQPGEFGNFIQDTANCPGNWQDGRIRYSITAVQTE